MPASRASAKADRATPCRMRGMLIGDDPSKIDASGNWFTRPTLPAGREKLDALGALTWRLGYHGQGTVCRFTNCSAASRASILSATPPASQEWQPQGDGARSVEAGFRVFRTRYPSCRRRRIQLTNGAQDIRRTEIREGVGEGRRLGHRSSHPARFAGRRPRAIEPLEPCFRGKTSCDLKIRRSSRARAHVKVPVAVGEQFGTADGTAS
jgi:hypothetical protein